MKNVCIIHEQKIANVNVIFLIFAIFILVT